MRHWPIVMMVMVLGGCDGERVSSSDAATKDVAGDGACTGTETAITAPDDCPALAGDGVCTGGESAATTREDCPTVHGDGLCTGLENAASAPGDCPAHAGDGLCTGAENAFDTPQDCDAIHGDGLCTGSEDAASAPEDCPARTGDGHCTPPENAATTPVDCPGLAGDGLCTGSEDPANAPADCPPPDVTFPGGTLASLRATSPTLRFGDLVITGTLVLTPADEAVQLHVESMTVRAASGVTVTQSTCAHERSPDLTILASGAVSVEGTIDLSGKTGAEMASASTCGVCEGATGGDLHIEADSLTIAAALSSTGGNGGAESHTFAGISVRRGCDAGDGGSIILAALDTIEVHARNVSAGGAGGPSTLGVFPGAAGTDGFVVWDAPSVTVSEQESNGQATLAQTLSLSPLALSGEVGALDDASFTSGTLYMRLGLGVFDRIEDLYEARHAGMGAATRNIKLTAADSAADVDLYVLDAANTTLVAHSSDSSAAEQLSFTAQPGATYLIAVSWFSGPATAYSLTLD